MMSKNEENGNKTIVAIKLCIYTLFVVIIAVFAIKNKNPNLLLEDKEELNEQNYEIVLSENYKYQIDINLDDILYKYIIEKNDEEIIIDKETPKENNNYIFKNNNYYLNIDNNYILSTEEKVFDIIDNNYLNITTINNYLAKSVKNDNKYIIYLKDIILESDNDKYITININKNKIFIDYTELMKELNIANYNCNVNIEIEE